MKYSELLVKLFNELKVKMRFIKYYKYTFTFAAENGEYRLELDYGGSAPDIRKFQVDLLTTLADMEIDDFSAYRIIRVGQPDKIIESGLLWL